MKKKTISIVLQAHEPYLRESKLLFSAIADVYMPFLSMVERLKSDGIRANVSLAISPILMSLFADKQVQEGFRKYMKRRISIAENEVSRTAKDAKKNSLAKMRLFNAESSLADFNETYKGNIGKGFASFVKSGDIEVLTTMASPYFTWLFNDCDEVFNAEIEAGISAQNAFFNKSDGGFWVPFQCSARNVPKILHSYGFSYTIFDKAAFLCSPEYPKTGIFRPIKLKGGFTLLASDGDWQKKIFQTEGRFAAHGAMTDIDKDAAFIESDSEAKKIFGKSGVRECANFFYESNDGEPYSTARAQKAVAAEAKSFVDDACARLDRALEITGDSFANLTFSLDLSKMAKAWPESIEWLEQILRETDKRHGIRVVSAKSAAMNAVVNEDFAFSTTSNQENFAEDFLLEKNAWHVLYMRKAAERMVDLANRFPGESILRNRTLNVAAREILLILSADWPLLIKDEICDMEAAIAFAECVQNFTSIYDALGANAISTEKLVEIETEHPIFPHLNYKIFAQ